MIWYYSTFYDIILYYIIFYYIIKKNNTIYHIKLTYMIHKYTYNIKYYMTYDIVNIIYIILLFNSGIKSF